MLDCLEPLSLGEVSPAVATPFGLHILRRDPLPPEERFSVDRIVIGYDGTDFLRHVARSPAAFERARGRKREEAFRLASELSSRATPENFRALVLQFSDHRDADKGGDIGVWSSHEPTIFPRLLDTILATPEGEISDPVDSELGFQILCRTRATERKRFALRARRLAFDPEAPNTDPNSSVAILEMANEALARWRERLASGGSPEQLPDLGEIEAWTVGRGPDGVDDVVDEVKPGELLPAPVRSDYTYLIGLRVEPTSTANLMGREWLSSGKAGTP